MSGAYISFLNVIIFIANFTVTFKLQEVGGLHRDEVISWFMCLNSRFHFTPETVALGVALTDRFLSLVKVTFCCGFIVVLLHQSISF